MKVFEGGVVAEFSSESHSLAIGALDGTVHIIDPNDGELMQALKYESEIWDLCFDSTGTRLAIATKDNKIRIWDLQASMETFILTSQFQVQSIAFDREGTELMCCDTKGKAYAWTTSTEKLVGLACERLTRNLSRTEWDLYVGKTLPYHQTCPNLPTLDN